MKQKKEYEKRPEVRARRNEQKRSPEYKAVRRKREKERRENDPLYNLSASVRESLKKILKGTEAVKNGSVLKLLNYTFAELEKKLNTGKYTMTDYLTNRKGKILFHIDHIIPLAYFIPKITLNPDGTYTKEGIEWIRKCNSPRNLRVWPAKENEKKNDDLDMNLVREHELEDLL